MAHHCHATDCEKRVPPEMFMCRTHWFRLPKDLRDRIWATYRVGQCDDMNPSKEYLLVAIDAVRYLAEQEGIEPDVRLYERFLESRMDG